MDGRVAACRRGRSRSAGSSTSAPTAACRRSVCADGVLDWQSPRREPGRAGVRRACAVDGPVVRRLGRLRPRDARHASTATRRAPAAGPATVAISDGLVANPEGGTMFRADSAEAAPVDGLRASVVPAFAHGLRFALDEGVLEASPAAGGPLRWRFCRRRAGLRAAARRRAPGVRVLAVGAAVRARRRHGRAAVEPVAPRASRSPGGRWRRAKGCCSCRRASG